MISIFLKEQFIIFKNFRLVLALILSSVISGGTVALFLVLLRAVINFRFNHSWILYLLPLAGILIHFIYHLYGKSSEKGNNLVIDEIHLPGAGIPKNMAPIILLCTLITHLFGGSAGREGTAVQIGGSIASMFNKVLKLNTSDSKQILMAGVAAGFGAVFGTPIAGAVFAIEVLSIGQIQHRSLFICLFASFLGDYTVSVLGVHHTIYHIAILSGISHIFKTHLSFDFLLLVKVIIASSAFGIAGFLFSELTYIIKNFFSDLFSNKWIIPLVGGLIIIGLTLLLQRPDYLSLGVDPEYHGAITVQSAFFSGGAESVSWLWKTIYTAVTIGTGFKGGEVTPLFYIGAVLGNTLSDIFNAPVSLFAALGFIAVFAGASNTPIACTILGAELFGTEHLIFYAATCFIAYYFSGNSGIYSAQRIVRSKFPFFSLSDESISDSHNRRRKTRKDFFNRIFFKGKTN